MTGLSIDNLPWPRLRYRIDRVNIINFETEEAALQEDRVRARFLRSDQRRSAEDQAACDRLAECLEREELDEVTTLASKLVLRDQRIRIIGALWQRARGRQAYFGTLMPRGLSIRPEDLAQIDPIKLNRWLRTTMHRCGANSEAAGWIFAYLDGEHNPATGLIQLHWHLAIVGHDMLNAVEALRRHPRFKRDVGVSNNADGIDRRIVVKPIPRRDLPRMISYVIKAAWFSKWRVDDDDGKRQTQIKRGRIQEPAGSMVLQWLDQRKFGDMAMMINLRAGRAGLIVR